MKKLLPVIFVLFGILAGGGTGYLMVQQKDNATEGADECTPVEEHVAEIKEPHESEYVKLHNQFVVPVVKNNLIKSMAVLSISIETREGMAETVYDVEPKLRDGFLEVLFDFAHIGGFDDDFTSSDNLIRLKRQLLSSAKETLGDDVSAVLISDLVRQDS